MKHLLIIMSLLCSSHVFAIEEIVALTKFYQTESGKMFRSQWFTNSDFGIINLGLVWAQYNLSVNKGFKLEEAQSAQFISPSLPEGCIIKSLKGNLNWLENEVSTVSATLTGRSCKHFFDTIKKTPIEINFYKVPHMIDTDFTEILHLQLTEIP